MRTGLGEDPASNEWNCSLRLTQQIAYDVATTPSIPSQSKNTEFTE